MPGTGLIRISSLTHLMKEGYIDEENRYVNQWR